MKYVVCFRRFENWIPVAVCDTYAAALHIIEVLRKHDDIRIDYKVDEVIYYDSYNV